MGEEVRKQVLKQIPQLLESTLPDVLISGNLSGKMHILLELKTWEVGWVSTILDVLVGNLSGIQVLYVSLGTETPLSHFIATSSATPFCLRLWDAVKHPWYLLEYLQALHACS